MAHVFKRTHELATRIESFKGADSVGVGTCFYYKIDLKDGKAIFCLGTNKHVVEGADNFRIWAHLEGSTAAKPIVKEMRFGFAGPGIYFHPNDEIDLCLINISDVVLKSADSGQRLQFTCFSSDTLVKPEQLKDIIPANSVLMIGCPNGLYDEVNHIPLTRRGITATPFELDYEGKPHFLVDIACFPGSSGSPILLFNRGEVVPNDDEVTYRQPINFALMGILFAGPTIDQQGNITFAVPKGITITSMMHLGIVIKSSELLPIEALVLASVAPN